MWNSQTERKKDKKIKNKKKVIIPILVLKQKTKHTHLKRCLYYNHLPQPLEICSPQKLLQKKKPSWSSDWVKKQSWNKIPMLMTMTSTPYPLAEKILMRRLLKKVLKILKVLKVPDWDTWKYWRYQIEWHWTCRQLARIVHSSLDSFESWRCPNSYQSTEYWTKGWTVINLLMNQNLQSNRHTIW